MKSMNAKLMALAATLAIAATNASAQVVLRASIPFSFQMSPGRVMPAGDYQIHHSGIMWTFTNVGSRVQTITAATAGVDPKPTDTPRLVFQCRASHCVLSRVVSGADEGGSWRIPESSKSDGQELARIVVVPASIAAR